eukprot:TRINITY_DN60703_c0_g1_i1.p1 TRINITY_DN60703_c0_g1~~TRINITY_DN60703_c0_g1_i1.p1  ORF type:complete len:566 (-),score=95.94 TRINITY_DN60703_c0_g1_i1:90-1787(-)
METSADPSLVAATVIVLISIYIWMERSSLLQLPRQVLEMIRRWHAQAEDSEMLQDAFQKSRMSFQLTAISRFCEAGILMCMFELGLWYFKGTVEAESLERMKSSMCLLGSCLIVKYAIPAKPQSYDAGIVLLSLLIVVRLHMRSPHESFVLFGGSRMMARTLIGLTIHNYKVSCCVNALFGIVNANKVLTVAASMPSKRGEGHVTFHAVATDECLSFMCVSAIFFLFDRWIYFLVMSKLQLQASESSGKACKKLLSALCDADLELAPTLEIKGPSEKLQHMLMSGQGGRSLEGKAFSSFLDHDDRQRFVDFIASSSNATSSKGEAPPTSLHVRIRDTLGIGFEANIFHVEVPDMDDQKPSCHLIGICESEHQQVSNTLMDHRALIGTIDREPPEALLRQVQAKVKSRPRAALSGLGSSRSASTSLFEIEELGYISFTFDAFSSEFNIKEARIGFPTEDPAESKALGLRAWLKQSSWVRFRDWVQDYLNACHAGKEGDFQDTLGSLKLRHPMSDSHYIFATFADVSGEADADGDGTDDAQGRDACCFLRVSLTGLIQKKMHSSLRR